MTTAPFHGLYKPAAPAGSSLLEGLVLALNMDDATDSSEQHEVENGGAVTFDVNGANFPGSANGFLEVPIAGNLQLAGHSLSIYFRASFDTFTTGAKYLFSCYGTDSRVVAEIYTGYTGAGGIGFLDFDFSDSDAGFPFTETGRNLSPNTFYDVIAWIDQDEHTINIQVDGNPPNSAPIAGGSMEPFTYADDLYIGSFTGAGDFLPGKMRRLYVWDRVLTPDERAEILTGAVYPFS